MEKKPSERIKETLDKDYWTNEDVGDALRALILILDEQWEAEQKDKPEEQVMEMRCGNCGFTGQIEGDGTCYSTVCEGNYKNIN